MLLEIQGWKQEGKYAKKTPISPLSEALGLYPFLFPLELNQENKRPTDYLLVTPAGKDLREGFVDLILLSGCFCHTLS